MSEAQARYLLVVEDSDDDFEFISEVIGKDLPEGLHLRRCETGTEAVKFLHAQIDELGPDSMNPCQMVLLDLNLPGKHGTEVLQDIKATEQTRSVPVIILTTSRNEKDVSNCYRLGANSYVQKPVDLLRFTDTLEQIRDYWLGLSVLPGNHDVASVQSIPVGINP
ncbi:MAG: response regulator [Pseudomonadales bacterium]|nr:response regulator [Pseudomonadales bacterium]